MGLTGPCFRLKLMLMDEPVEIDDQRKVRDYLSITLCISSDRMDPDSITQQLGIQPTSIRLRGTPIRNGMMRRPEFDLHEWWLRKELPLSESLLEQEAEQFISHFLSGLMSAAERIHALSEDHSVSVHLVYHMKYIPYIGHTRDHVRAVAALGARLEYDIMVDTARLISPRGWRKRVLGSQSKKH
jgi:Domain of unknown function (DUF4279)